MIYNGIIRDSRDSDRSVGIHSLQAEKKRVLFTSHYAGDLLLNTLTSKRIKGYVATSDIVEWDGHILKCSREKVPEQRALNAKTP